MREDLKKALEKTHPHFRGELARVWECAEYCGHPREYFADAGSVVVNGLHFSNGIGDGSYYIDVIYSDEGGFSAEKWTNTNVFFYKGTPITINIYDCMPESAYTCEFKREYTYAELFFDYNGHLIIFCHI